MVDVGDKPVTAREALARGEITMSADGAAPDSERERLPRAIRCRPPAWPGIMAAKQTAALIPLCHPLPLTHVSVELTPIRAAIASRRACGRRARPAWRWKR